MRKLRLDIEEVAVESFDVAPPDPHGRGTVAGHATDLRFCTQDIGGCLNSYGCYTAYCNESAEIACPTATCNEGCTNNCPGWPANTWNQTCPVTCDWGYGCESGAPNCPA
jgi:hypothetical protein